MPGDPEFLRSLLLATAVYLVDLVLFIPADPVVTLPFWKAHPVALAVVLAVAVSLLVATLRAVTDRRMLDVGLLWMAITLAPVLPLAPGERFLYLPSVGYCWLVGAAKASRFGSRARTAGLIGAMLAVLVVKNSVLGGVVARSRAAIDDAVRALDRAPDATALMVVDLPAAAMLGFPQAVRLEYPSRQLDIEILTVAPGFLASPSGHRSSVAWSSGSLSMRALGEPYLGSYIEHAFRGPARLQPGDRIERPSMTVTVREAVNGRVRAFDVRLRDRKPPPLVLRGTGDRLVRLDSRGDDAYAPARAPARGGTSGRRHAGRRPERTMEALSLSCPREPS